MACALAVAFDCPDQNVGFVVCVKEKLLEPCHSEFIDTVIQSCAEFNRRGGLSPDDGMNIGLPDAYDAVLNLYSSFMHMYRCCS